MFLELAFNSRVHRMKVEMLYRQSAQALLLGFMNVLVFSYVARLSSETNYLNRWIAAMGAVTLVRIFAHRYFGKFLLNTTQPFNPQVWENIFALGAFLTALGWGYAGIFLLRSYSLANEAFLGFVLAGTTAAAAVAYCTSMRTVMAFTLPAILPFILRLALGPDQIHHAMAGLSLFYASLLLLLVSRLKSRLIDALVVNFQKQSLAAELKTTKEQIGQTAKMAALGQMAGAIAHEINNPLAILRGYNGTLQTRVDEQRLDAAEVGKIVAKIDSTIVRMSKIITGLRVFGRDSRGDEFEQVTVAKIVNDTLELCQSRIRSSGVQLRLAELPDRFRISCQEVQVSQVLLNLLNNALDAVSGQPDAWIQLELVEELNELILSVTDSGAGIAPSIREKIMSPFFTTKGAGKGTGLGLSVAFDIMQNHRGSLRVDGTSANTKFVMTFPQPVQPNEP